MTDDNNFEFAHLNAAARKKLELPRPDRIHEINKDLWIPYSRAKEVLGRMEDILDYPRNQRMPGMLIVGSSNSGKSSIMEHFRSLHPSEASPESEYSKTPVLFVEAPNKARIEGLYNHILEALWEGFSIRASADVKEREIIRLFNNIELKVLLIDEIHHLLTGGPTKQTEFRQAIKSLSNRANISIICSGTESARNAIHVDEQLSDRLEPIELTRWQMDGEYAQLLNSFERNIPLKQPSLLRQPEIAQKILWMSEGILGHIHDVIKRAAVLAVSSGQEKITLDLIEKINWVMPSKRHQNRS